MVVGRVNDRVERMIDVEPCVIIGAGPSAAASAKALLSRGERVVVLDTGLTLDPNRKEARKRMADTVPSRWNPADLALTRFASDGQIQGYKRLFGSDLAFRDDGILNLLVSRGVAARPSYAIGGLSNVWGAGLLPYTNRDIADWPITAGDLAEGYRAVLDFLPYAAEEDELAESYPLMRAPDGPLIRTEAGQALLTRLRKHREALGAAGYSFGASRLAVRVGRPAPWKGCVYCAHCLEGCPYGHIYNAAQTIEDMRREGLIDYRPGLHVDCLREYEGAVSIDATPLAGGPGVRLRASRVFLAAGVVSTTVILQRSGMLPAQAEIADSQALYLPFVWVGRVGRTGREPGHTLAQMSVVLDDPAVCANPIHLTLYTYNDGLSERARASHPHLSAMLGPTLPAIARRLVIGICFLHSNDSDKVATSWVQGGRSVHLDPLVNPGKTITVKRFYGSLRRSLGRIGLIPLTRLGEIAPAGGGYHYGASIPMSPSPAFGECDLLGRPSSTRRIHVVDASCFPSVPGGAITFSAMANSHRIAMAAVDEHRQ